MLLTERRRKILTGSLLALGVVATRLPFISRYLFEFDSVDFAIATFRFDLMQYTPHPPGYILHVLLGKWLTGVTGDINLAYIWLSILLSVGSVLFLWRAGSHLRGERVGVIAGVLWLFAPMFWFYGEIATSYVHEAFFAAAILYYGIRLIREGSQQQLLFWLVVLFSLSIGARQSSVLFFTPAILYLFLHVRPPAGVLIKCVALFAVVSFAWLLAMIGESGGLTTYLNALGGEKLYTTQSILFGSPLAEHFGVVTKLMLFLAIGSFPVILIAIYGAVVFRSEFFRFCREMFSSRFAKFVLILIAPPFLFYSLIYFMKAGYLLNILPVVFLAGAVLLDHIAILHARNVRIRRAHEIVFTRRLITQGTVIMMLVLVNIEILWFTLPMPGQAFALYANLFSHQTFRESIESRYAGQEDKTAFFFNKAFAYSSSAGVRNIDSIHHAVQSVIRRESSDLSKTVIFDSWWQRFSYFYFPEAVCFDIRSYEADTLFSSLRMKEYTFRQLAPVEELPADAEDVFVIIRQEHEDVAMLGNQVRLTKVDAPPHIDIYRIEDSVFTLQWKNRTFVKR